MVTGSLTLSEDHLTNRCKVLLKNTIIHKENTAPLQKKKKKDKFLPHHSKQYKNKYTFNDKEFHP